MKEYSRIPLPILEGKTIPRTIVDKNGEMWWFYPEERGSRDPEIREEKYYRIEDKEEFYGYVTACKKCGARFQAIDMRGDNIRNYCPGCGKRLVVE